MVLLYYHIIMPRGRPPTTRSARRLQAIVRASLARKRYAKKVSSTRNANIGLNQSLQTRMFPVVKKCIMKYDDIYNMYHATGTPQLQVFKCNSLFDPDYSNVSGLNRQPVGFDQMMGVYNEYCVYACTAYVTATSIDRTYGTYLIAQPTLQPAPSVSSLANLQDLAQQTGTKRIYLPPDGTPRKFKVHFSCKNRFGVPLKEVQQADHLYGGDVGTNPARLGYILFCSQSGDNSVGSIINHCRIEVKLRFKCIFRQKAYIPADA